MNLTLDLATFGVPTPATATDAINGNNWRFLNHRGFLSRPNLIGFIKLLKSSQKLFLANF